MPGAESFVVGGASTSLYTHAEDEAEDNMLLEPPDPVDLLLAHSSDGAGGGGRASSSSSKPPLDFVREKMQSLKDENKRLQERVQDLEKTLAIVQTAQEWTVGRGMTQEQADKMKEIKHLLEQAKKAREDLEKVPETSKAGLSEKLRQVKAQLKKERDERKVMQERLQHAFEHGRSIKEAHQKALEQHAEEKEQWQALCREMQDRHHLELQQLQVQLSIRSGAEEHFPA